MARNKRSRKPALYVTITSGTKHLRVPRKRLFALVEYLAAASERPVHDVDVAVVDSRKIAAYNRRYLGCAGSTDVISFDLSGGPGAPLSAQIIVCGQVAVREAAARGHGVQWELMLYVVHGLLHLIGYDDRTAADAAEMYLAQENLLDDFLAEYRRALRKAREGRAREDTDGSAKAGRRDEGARKKRGNRG